MADQDNIIELLSELQESEIFSLAKTVTQGLLKIENREDALNGILKYSPEPVNILRRKVLTREILFSYLDKKNIPIRLPATKNDLIDRILEYWNSSKSTAYESHEPDQIVSYQNEAYESSNEGSVEMLAEQFSKWFYTQMNTEIVDSIHFFSDAKLKLSLVSGENCDNSYIENDPQEISNALYRLKLQHNLYFNPNFTKDGVQGRMDPHGLVIVLVCGTLHIEDMIGGVFEQVFALARDPFSENNWKIKHTELILRSKSDVMNQPRLCESELTSDLLQLPLDC